MFASIISQFHVVKPMKGGKVRKFRGRDMHGSGLGCVGRGWRKGGWEGGGGRVGGEGERTYRDSVSVVSKLEMRVCTVHALERRV